jgi:gluconokinase
MSTVLDEVALEGAPELAALLNASVRAEPQEPIVLTLDIGTSGVRSLLFDGRGDEIAGSHASLSSDFYAALRGGEDTDADALVELVERGLDLAVERAESLVGRIDYVAVSSFWHSLLGVDERDRAITPVFGWADTRAAEFADQLRAKFDERAIHDRTGCRFHSSYWPAKLLWLRADRSELFGKTARWLSFADYLALRLFRETATSVSMASATGLFDQCACGWDDELLETLKVPVEKLPQIALPGQTLHGLRNGYALRWPLLDRAAWFPAIGDGAANNIGVGCTTPEHATLMIGTSGAMRVMFAGAPPSSLPSELFCYRANRERVVVGGALSDGGGLIGWMRETLALNANEGSERELEMMEPDAHGLTVLPFWAGERSPGWSSAARGAIIGLTARTRAIEILRAAMEAISYRFALIAQALNQIAPNATIIGAGNALLSSPAWAQMIADVLGRPIRFSTAREASCRGAGLLALEAIGRIDSLETVQARLGRVFEPDITRQARYVEAIERQQELYKRLISHGDTESQSKRSGKDG